MYSCFSGLPPRTTFAYDFHGIPRRGFAAVNATAKILTQLVKLDRTYAILLLHETKGFPYNFACRIVETRSHL